MDRNRILFIFLALLFVLVTTVRLFVLFRVNIHWDEFHYLSQIYQFSRAEPMSSLQTAHVHLFCWLLRVGGNEADQVLAGRIVMFVVSTATLILWGRFLISRCSASATLLALSTVSAFSEMLMYGSSFRSDPLIAFLFAAALLTVSQGRAGALLSGAFIGCALLLNLKASVFEIWLILFLALERISLRAKLTTLSLHGAALFTAWILLFRAHSATLTPIPALSPSERMWDALNGFFFSSEGRGYLALLQSVADNPGLWILSMSAAVWLVRRSPRPVLFSLFGIVIALVYRNAWPYFLPGVFFPLSLVLGLVAGNTSRVTGASLGLPLALIVIQLVLNATRLQIDRVAPQRAIISCVHRLFPEPVPYIDRGGMIASFPRVGPFISGWELERYLKNGKPVYREAIENSHPQFLIANSPLLDPADTSDPYRGRRLLAEDQEALRGAFKPFRGVLRLAKEKPVGELPSCDSVPNLAYLY